MLRIVQKWLRFPTARTAPPSCSAAQLQVETLEARTVPTGSWTLLANPVPSLDGAQTMMLLSDGTVMVHGGSGRASSAWYRLTPDSGGGYAKGIWSTLAPMQTARLFFPSNVLPDGTVFVVGGEYTGSHSDLTYSTTAERFDPVANTWSALASYPDGGFGEASSELLPNGQVLVGSKFDSQTFVYDPASNTWSATGSKLRDDRSDEESWVKLPDDSILSYDIWASLYSGGGKAQRYLPATGQWVDAGSLPVSLSTDTNGYEIGPALLLPDGRAFFLGSNGNTAFYTPPVNATDPGTWTVGPAIPDGFTSADAPAAVLPNGHILLAAAPPITPDASGQSFVYPGPTKIYEFDPISNTYTDVTPSGFPLNMPTYQTGMLLLPTGQVLLCNDRRQIDLFTPEGTPDPSWQPTITDITATGANVYTLTGTQLNGLSEGTNYGDDAEMASNFPIVRLTDANGRVSYARTFNWSSTSVATGSTPQSVEFTLPAGTAPGAYLVSVIANGIASDAVLDVFLDAGPADVRIGADPKQPANVVITDNGSVLGTFPVNGCRALIVTGNPTEATITLDSTFSTLPVQIHVGTGTEHLVLGAGNVDALQGPVNIDAGGTMNPNATLVLDDHDASNPRSFTVSNSSLSWGGPLITYMGLGSLTIRGGAGGNAFAVLATASGTPLALVGGGNGDTLFGAGPSNLFTLLGTDSGTLGGAAYGDPVFFTGIANLVTGTPGATFQFADGASLSGNLVGSGQDTLDYSAYTTSVLVDLATGLATGVGGTVQGIATVDGGSGVPAVPGVYNLLIGAGGDVLNGGFGRRNLLVAGGSASTLNAGDEEDLLIAGSTAYDVQSGLDGWRQIAAYWASADDLATRVAHLLGGVGVPLLDPSLVIGNGGGNSVSGNGALALLYTNGLDHLAGFDPESWIVPIKP